MINKMVFKNWKLQQNDAGKFKVILNLIMVKNQFGGDLDVEKAFRYHIRNVGAYYNGEDEPCISTKYAASSETLQTVNDVLHIVKQFNAWVEDENYLRIINLAALHSQLIQKLYPIPEKE